MKDRFQLERIEKILGNIACFGSGGGSGPTPTAGTLTFTHDHVLAGNVVNIPTGLHGWSVTNTGSTNILVDGEILPPSATTRPDDAYLDPVANIYYRPPAGVVDTQASEAIIATSS